jgi:hypothetical protein
MNWMHKINNQMPTYSWFPGLNVEVGTVKPKCIAKTENLHIGVDRDRSAIYVMQGEERLCGRASRTSWGLGTLRCDRGSEWTACTSLPVLTIAGNSCATRSWLSKPVQGGRSRWRRADRRRLSRCAASSSGLASAAWWFVGFGAAQV